MGWIETIYRDENKRVDIEPRYVPQESDLLEIRGGDDYDIFVRDNKFVARSRGNHHEETFDDFRDLEEYINFDYYCELAEKESMNNHKRKRKKKKKK